MILRDALVDRGEGEFEPTDVVVDGRRIAALGRELAADARAEVVDCSRFAIVPGMVNAHCHSNENWFRGRLGQPAARALDALLLPGARRPGAEPARGLRAHAARRASSMLRSGATCVVDFLYELQGFSEESLDAVVRAYRDLGLRALIALGMVGPRLPRDGRARRGPRRPAS